MMSKNSVLTTLPLIGFSLALFLGSINVFAHSWDKQINDPNRFKVLGAFNNEAVLDKETGLVWQKSSNIQR